MLADDELTKPELEVWDAAGTGEWVDLSEVGKDERNEPTEGATWGEMRTVRAELLAELLTGEREAKAGRLRAVKVRGARITGRLDLEAAKLRCPLELRICYVENPIKLDEAQAPAIRLPGSFVPSLSAASLRIDGNLDLDEGFSSYHVNLLGAHIDGHVSLRNANLYHPGGDALRADRLIVEQTMFCEQLMVIGEVSLAGAQIHGRLTLDDAILANSRGPALVAERITVDRDLSCDSLTTQGQVVLAGSHIGGHLQLRGASLANPTNSALSADMIAVDGDMVCQTLRAQGEITLSGAKVNGVLRLDDSVIANPGGQALHAVRLHVEQDFICSGLSAQGEIRLADASIRGHLVFVRARLVNPGTWQQSSYSDRALLADGLNVGQDLRCQELIAQGEVILAGAKVNGVLRLDDAVLSNPGKQALIAVRLHVGQDLVCQRLIAQGGLRLFGTKVGGELVFTGAILTGTNPDRNLHALDLEQAEATDLYLNLDQPPHGVINLTNAKIDRFVDDPEAWPQQGRLRLRGFAYQTLANKSSRNREIDVGDRLRWLELVEDPDPQLYEHLADYYRRAGRDDDARRVLIAKQRRRRRAHGLIAKIWNGVVWNGLLRWLVGYGYQTWRSLLWLLGLLVVGTAVFNAQREQLTPVKPASELPAFNPAVYTLDVLLPIVNLGQQDAWLAHGSTQWFTWALILAGWLLTTAVVLALTGVLKRD